VALLWAASLGFTIGMALALLRPAEAKRLVWRGTAIGAGLGLVIGCFRVVPPGHVGILEHFGRVREGTLEPGLRLALPLAKLTTMPLTPLEWRRTLRLATADGQTARATLIVRGRILPGRADALYRAFGARIWSHAVPALIDEAAQSAAQQHPRAELALGGPMGFGPHVRTLLADRLEGHGLFIEDVVALIEPHGP
jgi:hypothetical protein